MSWESSELSSWYHELCALVVVPANHVYDCSWNGLPQPPGQEPFDPPHPSWIFLVNCD